MTQEELQALHDELFHPGGHEAGGYDAVASDPQLNAPQGPSMASPAFGDNPQQLAAISQSNQNKAPAPITGAQSNQNPSMAMQAQIQAKNQQDAYPMMRESKNETQVVKGVHMSPAERMALQNSQNDSLKAIQGTADVEKGQANQEKDIWQNHIQSQQSANDAEQTRVANQAKAEADYRDKLAFDIAQHKANKIDAGQYWNSMGTGQKILSVIGVALGGVNGHGNQAMDVINKNIDRNIEGQKANYEGQGKTIDEENNMYSQLRQKGYDDRQSYLGAKQALLEKTQNGLMNVAAQTKNAYIQAKANQALADTKAAQTKTLIDLDLASKDKTISTTITEDKSAKPNFEQQKYQREMSISNLTGKVGELGIGGPNDAKQFNNIVGHTRGANSSIDKLNELLTNGTWTTSGLTTDSALAHNEYLNLIKEVDGMKAETGRLSPTTEQYRAEIGDPTKFFTNRSHSVEVLNQLKDSLANDILNQEQQYKVHYN